MIKRKVSTMRAPAPRATANPNADLDAAAANIATARRMIEAQTAYRDAIMQRGTARAAAAQLGGVAQAEMAVANTRARMLDIEIEVATRVCNQQQAELDAEKVRRGVV